MNFIIADTFQRALERLEGGDRTIVKLAAFEFQMNPKSPGFSYEPVRGARDRDLWSFRASDGLRVIVHRTPATFALCYAGRHDEAYRWAQNRKIEFHPVTGAAQIVETVERVEEHVRRVVREEVVEPPVFGRFERRYLLALGVPESWLDAVLHVSDDGLATLLSKLPQEAAERLLDLACGNPVPIPAPAAGEGTGFAHPDAQRRFRVIEREDELRRALDAPWDRWMVFLHPSQSRAVRRRYNGPARISGAAGTGKTVVAVHRAAELARRYREARILLTTFSKTLALRLALQVRTLLGADSPEMARVTVAHVHKVARDIVAERRGAVTVVEEPEFAQIWAECADDGADVAYLRSEWAAVVDPAGLSTWEEYREASRSQRGVPLGEKARLAAWGVFERVRERLRERGLLTWDQVCLEAATAGAAYDHVVSDEYQDFGRAEMRLLRALVPPGADDLFLAGDPGQRIYKAPCSWLSLGIDVRGRSSSLTVNYRTTEQIRRFADRIVQGKPPDGMEEAEAETRHSLSLLQGPEPEVFLCGSAEEETQRLAEWLAELAREGVPAGETAVFARSESVAKEHAEMAAGLAGLKVRLLRGEEVADRDGAVSVGTMHRAKGLEFRAVAVLGCDARTLPRETMLEKLTDPLERADFLERERHLLYVACTRARERLLVTASGGASEFLGFARAAGAAGSGGTG